MSVKSRYRLFRRAGGTFYAEDRQTGKQESLKTKDPDDARALLDSRNGGTRTAALNLALGKSYMAASDPKLATRTWADAMALWASTGTKDTRTRKERAIKCKAFDLIRKKVITATTADNLYEVMRAGGVSVNHFLRVLHNLAMDNGWLGWPIIAPAAWPKAQAKWPKRAITREEHEKIVAVEPHQEWRNYFELLWEVGCAQTDGATLTAEHIDWQDKTLAYQRHKMGGSSEPALMTIGPRLEALLSRLPKTGVLFPKVAALSADARALHFAMRREKCGIEGVTLHSYRYAWAERGAKVGYPERWAKSALGHSSSAVHRSYARKAKVVVPSIEEYEAKVVPLRQSA